MAISSVNTVNRLVQILDSFTLDHPTWSLADLSAQLGMPKSTLHRFLVSLEAHGILRRDSQDKLWRLGYRLVIWGALAERVTGIRHIAEPVMQELAAKTGEMVALTVYVQQEVVCIAKIDTRYSVRLALEVGARRPAHAGASSKILMAYLSEEEVQSIIRERGLAKLCTRTIVDPDELRAELARIREQGFAESIEETDLGAWGIATPVFGRQGEVVAAIGVAGPIQRYSLELAQRFVDLCQGACRQIAGQLA
jgi:IclR family KDG regulon transcriptional repressor